VTLGAVMVDNLIVLGVLVGAFGLLMIGVQVIERWHQRYPWGRTVQAVEEARERYYTGRPSINVGDLGCSWKRRTSSKLALSGDRPIGTARSLTGRT
jgi:hypothetical protein